MITTWLAAIAAASSSLRWLTGSSAGYVMTGTAAALAARRAAADSTSPASLVMACSLAAGSRCAPARSAIRCSRR